MNKKKKYKQMTEKEFKQLKYLLSEMDMSLRQVTELTGRSDFTLRQIQKATDFADYKTNINQILARKSNAESKTVEPEQYNIIETNSQAELLAILSKINDNIARLVEAWHATERD